MNSRGLLHFDAHFGNVLTDGRRLYFADYGLAISSRFELSWDEADFFDRHAPIAAVVSDFDSKFRHRSRQTPYPLEGIRRIGLPAIG